MRHKKNYKRPEVATHGKRGKLNSGVFCQRTTMMPIYDFASVQANQNGYGIFLLSKTTH